MVKVSGHLVLPTISYGSFSKEGSEFTVLFKAVFFNTNFKSLV